MSCNGYGMKLTATFFLQMIDCVYSPNPLRESRGGGPYDHPLCPGLQPGPPSQTPGGLGQSMSEVTWPPNLEFRRWGSSGPSSLMPDEPVLVEILSGAQVLKKLTATCDCILVQVLIHLCVNHKNIVRHTAHTIVSWPNPKQWLMIHTSGLMMIIR